MHDTIDDLLKPITNQCPVGVNIRLNENLQLKYYHLKELRKSARSQEVKFIEQEAIDDGLQIWNKVSQDAVQLLKNVTKDLEIVAWLIEAWLRIHGLAGLAQGLTLASSLCEHYWDTLHPQEDEDGIETKIASFSGLNGIDSPGSLVFALGLIKISENDLHPPFHFWQYKVAVELNSLNSLMIKERQESENHYTLEDIYHAAKETNINFHINSLDSLKCCQNEFFRLNKFFQEHCGNEAPPYSFIKNALVELEDALNYLYKNPDKNHELLSGQKEMPVSSNENKEGTTNKNTLSNVTCRRDALDIINKAVLYFEQNEPHSPISFLLQKAIKWGHAPLPELLSEIIISNDEKANLEKLIGIQLLDK